MAEGTARKGGKKNRKYGRNSDSGCMKRYKAENRDGVNKKRRIENHLTRVATKAACPPKVTRGTARAKRRIGVPDSRFAKSETQQGATP